ncbi:class I SAM-dependent methyltransferase [Candidatus Woesearchaeota archaeon]|nr:class I SAM-dependent methyltransferase [Candidatus Woesearchaeota archaeon]
MEHYFTKSPKSELKIKKLKAILRKKEIEFYTASGLFSINQVDKGSELLINKCLIENNWKILDLGCGYGIIGLSLLKFNITLKLTFSDINERAIQITKKNLEFHKLKAELIQSDGFESIKEKFNTILLNPPQTAGKKLCFKLIEDSKQHLEKEGYLQIVARHNKGGKELSKKMFEVFNNVKEISKSAGYRIYISKLIINPDNFIKRI